MDKPTTKKSFFYQNRAALIYITLAVITLLIRWVLEYFPDFVERVYSKGIYEGFRWLFDANITRLPFPLVYILIGLLFLLMVRGIYRFFKNKYQLSVGKRIGRTLLGILGFLGLTIFLFFWLWGFNYFRVPVEEKLGIPLSAPDSLVIMEELELTVHYAMLERRRLSKTDTIPLGDKEFLPATENHIRASLVGRLAVNGYPSPGEVQIRSLPKGSLLRFGTAGIYLPFVGEGHIDGGLHPIAKPFTTAHEMAHAYGFGDEGTCNFWGYLSCIGSNEPSVRYSGHMGYLRYLLSTLRRFGEEGYIAYRQCLPPAILVDMADIRVYNARYPDLISAAPLNNVYLKAQGVEGGIENYSRIVVLVSSLRRM